MGVVMRGNFRKATLEEYVEWLKGYIRHGGEPTHYRPNMTFARYNLFLYVTGRFQLQGESGASARHIIVDKRAELVMHDFRVWPEMGHNVLHYMKGYKSQDRIGTPAGTIPILGDAAFLEIRGMKKCIERIQQQAAARQKTEAELVRKRVEERKNNPLSSANDRWTGNPAINLQDVVGRALQSRPRP